MFAQAAKISHPPFLLLYRANALGHARLGIIVGKNIYKRAVDRNRIRRVIRESFRQRVAMPNFDIVVLFRSSCGLEASKALRETLDYLWQTLEATPCG